MTQLSRAHSLLHYLVTQAALNGNTESGSVTISYCELKESINEQDIDYLDTDLKVSISLEWMAPWEPGEEDNEQI